MISRAELNGLIGHEAVDEAAEASCWSCGHHGLFGFYLVRSVPTQSCVLLDDASSAEEYPLGDVLLGFCESCGFIQNARFDPARIDYSVPTEESQAFSETFQTFARALVEELVDRYSLTEGEVLEVGCGKGDFLVLLAEEGVHAGTGIDPGFLPNREVDGSSLTFIRDFYGDRYRDLSGDLVISRHLLEHISALEDMLPRLVSAIAPGGSLFTELPDTKRVLDEVAFWDVYYEHCSYFTMSSLDRLLTRHGLTQTHRRLGFDDQYLLVDSVPTTAPEPPSPVSEAEAHDVVRFGTRARAAVLGWRELIQSDLRAGRRVALWGGGSKAIAFLTTLAVGSDVAVVDINPHKQGMWLAGTRIQVVAPEELASGIDTVVAMNPIYLAEITRDLEAMNLRPRLLALGFDQPWGVPAH